MKNWKIVLAILTVNVVLMAAGYTMLIPFLPMYLMNELGVSADDVKMWNGAIFSITFLIGGIMAPIWGKMADTRGKKMMAVRAGAGLALSYFFGGIVTTPEQMFGVRVLQGFAAGLWSACLAIATSLVPMECHWSAFRRFIGNAVWHACLILRCRWVTDDYYAGIYVLHSRAAEGGAEKACSQAAGTAFTATCNS